MRRYYFICIIIAAILVVITLSYRNEPTKFHGIADMKETIINSEDGVEIQKLYVVPGQAVAPGDTIVALEQPELRIRINEIMHTLNEYKAQKQYQTKYSLAEKRKYEAEQAERINEITSEIRELEAQYELNKKLVKELRSLKIEAVDENDSANPIQAQIMGLKQLLESAKNPSQSQIDFFGSALTTSNDPIQSQVSRYADELELLLEKQRQLVKVSPIGGMVGMVKYKAGERVSPFDTILTLHTAAPSFVNGYIHENVYSRVTAGDTVQVLSFADDKHSVKGRVLSVGSRIVDYPMRLRSRQEIPIWGREVIVKIPDENRFLMGEKVLISVLDKKKRWIFPLIPAHMVGK